MPDSTPSNFRPLFRLDPGWPFVLAGLALLIAGILIPAQRELHELRGQQKVVEATEARVYARLEAYDRFLSDLRSSNPDLIRRLAIANLNMVPKGEQSLLLTPGLNQSVAQWIDESVPTVKLRPEPYPDTLLGRLAVGPNRLWMLAASVFLLFVGLLFGPDPVRPVMEPAAAAPPSPVDETGHPESEPASASDDTVVATEEPADDPMTRRSAAMNALPASVASITDDEVIDVEVVDDEILDANRSPSELDEAFEDRVTGGETDRPIVPPHCAD